MSLKMISYRRPEFRLCTMKVLIGVPRSVEKIFSRFYEVISVQNLWNLYENKRLAPYHYWFYQLCIDCFSTRYIAITSALNNYILCADHCTFARQLRFTSSNCKAREALRKTWTNEQWVDGRPPLHTQNSRRPWLKVAYENSMEKIKTFFYI